MKLLDRLPKQVIGGHCSESAGPLMIRYSLLRNRWFSVVLHHFMRSDMDRAFHDHPWWFCTLLLSGPYVEHTPLGVFRRRRFSVLLRLATWQHWVEIEKPVWTLVVKGRTKRDWGFIENGTWTPWRQASYKQDC